MATIYDRIDAGEFKNNVPYIGNVGQSDRWTAEQRRLDGAFRKACEEEAKVEFMSEKSCDALWNKAWNDGHANGYSEVWGHYRRLAELALIIYDEVFAEFTAFSHCS